MVEAALADQRTAPVGEGLRAVLDLLEAVTLRPRSIGPGDVARVRAAGVSDGAIEDALYVCAYFNVIDRLADSLGFDLPTREEHESYAAQFYDEGYGNEV